jgi:GNAT superfamily N-acetyltransferase
MGLPFKQRRTRNRTKESPAGIGWQEGDRQFVIHSAPSMQQPLGMSLCAIALSPAEILPWLEESRRVAPGQVVHDSLHARPGWTQSYLLQEAGQPAGFGAVAVGGPWQGTRTVFAFHVSPGHHSQAAGLFAAFLRASSATHFEIQTEPGLLHDLARPQAKDWSTDAIIFRAGPVTALPVPAGATFRKSSVADRDRGFAHHAEPVGDWVVEVDGVIAATGGWLSHYNPPHHDLYLEVAEPYRRRGLGSWLLQELKLECRAIGGTPCGRTSPRNLASRTCLARAGFTPWCEIVCAAFTPDPVGATINPSRP